jgi:beta-glucosidase
MTETTSPGVAADLRARLPANFAWGVASSAYQIEGAASEDGRGPSIWDTFSRQPGRVVNGENGDVACDHYHRWREDIDLMSELGISAYRFSVAWPRVIPAGSGQLNGRGLDFYDRLVDGLLDAGITPTLNLFHWDLPQALQDRGGWANPEIVGWFGEYAAAVAGRLGDRVDNWMTLNEPQVFAFTGHATGKHAPGLTDWRTAVLASHHALLAHAAAAKAIRAGARRPKLGIALDINHAVPASDSEADQLATRLWRSTRHAWFLDPLFGRGYPALARAAHEAAGHLDGIELTDPPPGELDFVGLNYYCRETVAAGPNGAFRARVEPPPGAELTEMGWHVAPDGLTAVLHDLHAGYAPAEIVVSENGAAFVDPSPLGNEPVPDPARRAYLANHVAALADAVDAGVPVTGYHVWSLLDNFEWSFGYGRRFGIVYVDFATQRRVPKTSYLWYRELVRG